MDRKDKLVGIADVLMMTAETARDLTVKVTDGAFAYELTLAEHIDALADEFLLLAEAERMRGRSKRCLDARKH